MPARDAALRAMADACALGADVTVEVAQALLRRRIERAGANVTSAVTPRVQ